MKHLYILLFVVISGIAHSQSEKFYCEEINSILRTSNAFPFGVASGDPTESTVVLTTTLNPFKIITQSGVVCEVSETADFKEIRRSYSITPNELSAYSIKVNATNLAQNKTYYYRFQYGGETSMVGKTKTIASNPSSMQFAVVSCSNYEWGFFNAYESIAIREDIDFVIHLGDYIYEYGPNVYGNSKLARKHLPGKELITLQDYRSRYAQYRLDPQLQKMHQNMPMLSIWDDHEFANDAYADGAQNHQAEEGSWEVRKRNAQQAYFEWLPITDNTLLTVRRSFHYGNFVDLYLLDERIEGRSQQGKMDSVTSGSMNTMLGQEQKSWLMKEMEQSHATWGLIGNQVLFSSLTIPSGAEAIKKNNDMWIGYPTEHDFLLEQWKKRKEKNLIILTGDAHSSFSISLGDVETPIGKEWVTPSVTSANLDEKLARRKVKRIEKKLLSKNVNPQLDMVNLRKHGYMIVRLTESEAQASWYFVKTLNKVNSRSKKSKQVIFKNAAKK